MAIKNEQAIARDGGKASLWQTGLSYVKSNVINEPDGVYDILIIGGGITGITTALQLQNSGKKCLLVEAETIGYSWDCPCHGARFDIEGKILTGPATRGLQSLNKKR